MNYNAETYSANCTPPNHKRCKERMMAAQTLTQERLKELFDYNPSTGVFSRIKLTSNRSCPIGPLSKRDNGNGYSRIRIDHKLYYMHRLAWFFVYGSWPKEIDHINGDRGDNRIENLRPATRIENGRNLKKTIKNTSGVMGVFFNTPNKKWGAVIGDPGTNTYQWLGRHVDWFEAVCARKSAENRHGYHPNHGRIQGHPND